MYYTTIKWISVNTSRTGFIAERSHNEITVGKIVFFQSKSLFLEFYRKLGTVEVVNAVASEFWTRRITLRFHARNPHKTVSRLAPSLSFEEI